MNRRATVFIVLCIGAVTLAAVLDLRHLLTSYLVAFLFCLGLSLGALANLMLHEVTGGRWGLAVRAPLTAAARLVPLTALLAIPLLIGMRMLYPWVDSQEPEVLGKSWWLNPAFFAARGVIYILIWSLLAWYWLRLAARCTTVRPPALRRFSAFGLIVYGLTVSLAAVDWIMSLLPRWYSSAFGLLIVTAQMLSAMTLAAWACSHDEHTEADRLQDIGNLLLTYVMTWAYVAFTQFLIIWAEDLPTEIVWYLPRVQTSWRWLTLFVFVAQFALPFLLLLARSVKRSHRALGRLAAALLVAQLAFNIYLVLPVVRPDGIAFAWTDPVAIAALLALWLAAWWFNFHDRGDEPAADSRSVA